MNVRELNEKQLEELKISLFNDLETADDRVLDRLADELYFDEFEILDKCDYPFDIPNEIIYKLYDGISFVEEDFWSVYDEE